VEIKMSIFEMIECDFSEHGEHDWINCGRGMLYEAIFECKYCGCRYGLNQFRGEISKTMIQKPRELKIELEDLNEQ
jgi:hypothetical protein